jgi:muramidase (phage lysozyme)
MDSFFNAIAEVESHHNDSAVGDNGASIGRYQIQYNYWFDARMSYGTHEDCIKPEYARKVMLRYWARYVPQALARQDFEVLSRVHNGGPKGHLKKSTIKYWQLVRAQLEG